GRWSSFCMSDTTGQRLTFGRALTGAVLLSRSIRRRAGTARVVGVLLPASVGGALANIATTCAGKAAVNLNFTAGREAMMHAIERAELKTIITSRQFLKKASIEPLEGMVFLEDLVRDSSGLSRAATLLALRIRPAVVVNRVFGVHPRDEDVVARLVCSG